MGFCRRCGEIVVGTRCRCGGSAAAPAVPWNQSKAMDIPQDKWSKIYVQRARSVSPTRPTATSTPPTAQTSSTKRFPRPISHTPSLGSNINSQVSKHITSSISYSGRPPSPLKHSSTILAPDSDILPSLHDTTLSKVYGSVLQPRETLTTHSCALCSSPFPPDATIYPDPTMSSPTRFLCRPCYETNGGTKGICPSCSRPVLTLKSEGGFIHAAGQFWHKTCFNCLGCYKNIGDIPMVDLLGHPSCSECFENCLKRDTTPKKYISTSNNNSPRFEKTSNPGGMSSGLKTRQSREGSPAIEELQQRLGIARSREGSPAVEELSQRLTILGRTSSPKPSNSSTTLGRHADGDQDDNPFSQPSEKQSLLEEQVTKPIPLYSISPLAGSKMRSPNPVLRQFTGSPVASPEAVEEMKQRFMKAVESPSSCKAHSSASPIARGTPPLRLSHSSSSVYYGPRVGSPVSDSGPGSPSSSSIPPTPDMLSDFSDTMTQSSLGPDSPPRDDMAGDIFTATKLVGNGYSSRYLRTRDSYDGYNDIIAEETSSQLGTPNHTPNSTRVGATPTKGSLAVSSSESPLRSRPVRGSSSSPADLSTTSCVVCAGNLLSIKGGGKFVTVPADDLGSPPATYHASCFRCTKCDGVFSEAASGRAAFVKAHGSAYHIECAPPAKVMVHKMPSVGSLHTNPVPTVPTALLGKPPLKTTVQSTYTSSRKLEQPPLAAPPTSRPLSFPRFGSSIACPGCNNSVSPMEQGVVPGPQGTRWHASCLVCGGKRIVHKGIGAWRGREERKRTDPGCGKRLDSAAKTSAEGGVWCRECSLLLVGKCSPQSSPTRSPLVPSFTGITPQLTGTTTIARQFTGIGGGDPGLLRQLTGGSLSPTRSISPTKQLGSGMRPRPKSVIGMRNTKSIDEGRGMYLVKQLTGAG